METVCCGVAAALAFIGFVAVIYFIALSFYKPRGNGRYIITIPPDGDRDAISSLIYGAHLRNMLFGDLISDSVIVLDNGLGDETRELIIRLSKEYGSVEICTVGELESSLLRKEKDGTGAS